MNACIADNMAKIFDTLTGRFDASGKGAYARLSAMVDVVGRWICGVGRGSGGCWKMKGQYGASGAAWTVIR